MKKPFFICLLFMSFTTFADHSLKSAMDDSAKVKSAVNEAMKRAKVVCDVEFSMQMSTKGSEANKAWRQVAFCYKKKEMMISDREMLKKGNSLGGIYGVTADAILDVTYSFNKEMKADSVLEFSLK